MASEDGAGAHRAGEPASANRDLPAAPSPGRGGSGTAVVMHTGVRRWFLLGFANVCLVLAFVGVWVPGMPTTVFVLMAAWAAMRSSPKLHARLESHRVFGPLLRNWREHRAVSRRAKWLATITMAFCALLCFLTAPAPWMAWLGTGIMAVVACWLWLRPEPPMAPDRP